MSVPATAATSSTTGSISSGAGGGSTTFPSVVTSTTITPIPTHTPITPRLVKIRGHSVRGLARMLHAVPSARTARIAKAYSHARDSYSRCSGSAARSRAKPSLSWALKQLAWSDWQSREAKSGTRDSVWARSTAATIPMMAQTAAHASIGRLRLRHRTPHLTVRRLLGFRGRRQRRHHSLLLESGPEQCRNLGDRVRRMDQDHAQLMPADPRRGHIATAGRIGEPGLQTRHLCLRQAGQPAL